MESENETRKYRFDESTLRNEAFQKLGLTPEILARSGVREELLEGKRTQRMVPIKIKGESFTLSGEGKLQLRRTPEGDVMLRVSGRRPMPEMKSFLGYEFSDQEREEILSTGHLGHTAVFQTRDGAQEAFLSFDRDTNEFMLYDVRHLSLPREIGGVKLDEKTRLSLREGKSVHLTGVSARDGNKFDCEIRVSAIRRGLEFKFDTPRESYRKILGVELDENQRKELLEGKAVYLQEMLSHSGKRFSAWVKLSPEDGRLKYFQQDPDKKAEEVEKGKENNVENTSALKEEKAVPQKIGGVALSPSQQQALLQGEKVFLSDMQDMEGERFSAFVSMSEQGKILYQSAEQKVKIPGSILGVKLSAKQRESLEGGESIFLEGLHTGGKSRDDLFLKRDERFPDRILFFKENPKDNPELTPVMIGKIEPKKEEESLKNQEPLKQGGGKKL